MRQALDKKIAGLSKNMAARSLSERITVLALAALLLGAGSYFLVFEPAQARIDSARSNQASAARQIESIQQSIIEMQALMQQDPNEVSRARLLALTKEQERLDQQIEGLAKDLISPSAMTELLISMLKRQEGLRLVSFENVSAIPLSASRQGVMSAERSAGSNSNSRSDNGGSNEEGVLYEHGLRIEFEGDYLSTLQYLKFLESVSASFFWDRLHFSQTQWPAARVVLEIHTLSTEEGFIGV
ncbi:MAG: type II secretion system protein GspM [Gammaproteobacteria bacterium]|nr:type II secretion system protein GspM [Gammaproteobacteria bacterium]